MSTSMAMDRRPRSGISYRTAVILLVALFFLAVPFCWALGARYGVDRGTASNIFYFVFEVVFTGILLLPFADLAGQEGMSRDERLERMAIAWLCLQAAAAVFWSIPWIILVDWLVAARGQWWAYLWWSYMEGGDVRYAAADGSVLGMETAGAINAMLAAALVWRRAVTGRFTRPQLLWLMAVMAGTFYGITVYFLSGLYNGAAIMGGPGQILIKFIGSNIFWLVVPPFVFLWAGRRLLAERAA